MRYINRLFTYLLYLLTYFHLDTILVRKSKFTEGKCYCKDVDATCSGGILPSNRNTELPVFLLFHATVQCDLYTQS